METNEQKTVVIFRKWNDGQILALFPYDIARGYFITCYAHIGQHSAADYQSCIERSKPAKESEYKALKCELEQRGYNLKIQQKQNYSKYLKAYREHLKSFLNK